MFQHLKLSAKLALLVAIAAIPLLLFAGLWVRDQTDAIATAHNEHDGALVAGSLMALAKATQALQASTELQAPGSGSTAAPPPAAAREPLQQAMSRSAALLAERPDWGLDGEWQQLAGSLNALASGAPAANGSAGEAAYTRSMHGILSLMERVGETSQLLYDPVAMTYFLAEITIDRMMPWSESAARLRDEGAGLLARGESGGPAVPAVLGRVAVMESQLDALSVKLEALRRTGGTVPEVQQRAETLSRGFMALARQSLGREAAPADAKAFFAAGTEAMEAIAVSQRAIVGQLAGLLQEREDVLRRNRALAIAGGLACAALLMALALAIARGTLRATDEVARALKAAADGDLTQPLSLQGDDEFATMGRSVNSMRERLGAMVRTIQGDALGVMETGMRLSSESEALAERTVLQASSVEESAASLEQVSASVHAAAERVQQVEQLFSNVAVTVDAGVDQMQAAVTTVEGIEAGSARVAEIVGVIDGIAFQTNILALNAAVEAARAGESGRGFAVVASEVRMLAKRSSTAAGEIRNLIAESTAQVAAGCGQIRSARDSLSELLNDVQRVAHALGDLAMSAREQSQAVSEVYNDVRDIGSATQLTAASVERASVMAHSLGDQAEALNRALAAIRVARAAGLDEVVPA